jgi:hypothetical protein
MLPTQILDRFIDRCPAVVLVRATLERLLRPERLDQIFEDATQRQYTKQLLFSQVVAVMTAVSARGLSHGATSIADSCFRNSSGVSLRNSQRVKSGNFRPSRPYGV